MDSYWTINGLLEAIMFKKTLNFSELKSDPSSVSDLKDGEVVQIFHRGHDVKVMMTQEHFFSLMSKLEKIEGTAKRDNYDPQKLMSDFDEKMQKLNNLLNKAQSKGKAG